MLQRIVNLIERYKGSLYLSNTNDTAWLAVLTVGSINNNFQIAGLSQYSAKGALEDLEHQLNNLTTFDKEKLESLTSD